MKNVIKSIVCMILLGSVLLCCMSCGSTENKKAETCAINFIKNMYEGNAQAWTDLILDSVLEQDMIIKGYQTEALYVYSVGKFFDELMEDKKTEYGKKWKYDISVIDSYPIELSGEFVGQEVVEVCLKVEHSGKKLLFFKVSDVEEIKVQVINKDDTWYVIDWSFAIL